VHAVVVDASALADGHAELAEAVAARGARLVVADVAVPGEPRHDPVKLAATYAEVLGSI